MKLLAVFTTVASLDAARRMGRAVVEHRLAACAQIGEIESFYAWQGEVANDREFRALLAAVGAGRLRPRIDRVLPLSRAPEAYRLLEEGRQFGKIVLVPDGSALAWPDGD